MTSARIIASVGALAGLLAFPTSAVASAFDVMGFGTEGIAEAGARAARADDGTATFYNPAGLGFGVGAHATASPTLGVSSLAAQHTTLSLSDPFGIAFAFDATVPFEGVLRDRLRIGFGGYLMPSGLARVLAHATDTPFYPYYDNRTQRAVVIPALGVRVFRSLSVGVGVNVLAGVGGPASVAPGPSGAPEPRITIDAQTELAANVGVRFDPTEHAHFGLVYRQGAAVPARLDTTAVVGGVPLAVTIDMAQSLFDPDAFVAASSFDVGPLALEFDATYSAWSSYAGPFVNVDATLPGVHVASVLPGQIARDVVSARGAAALGIDFGGFELTGRAGAGFEPSMLRSFQQGTTNLVDGDKIFTGLGGTLRLKVIPRHALTFGVGAGAQIVLDTEQDKRTCDRLPCGPGTVVGPDALHPSAHIDNPGYPRLTAGGIFWTGAVSAGVEL